MPASTLASVLLPAPFSPHRAWHEPAATSKEIPSSARAPGNHLLTPSKRRMGAASGAPSVASTVTVPVAWGGAVVCRAGTAFLLALEVRLGDVGEAPDRQLARPVAQVLARHAHRLHRDHRGDVLLAEHL